MPRPSRPWFAAAAAGSAGFLVLLLTHLAPADELPAPPPADGRPAPTYELKPDHYWKTIALDCHWETRLPGLLAMGELAKVDPALVPFMAGVLGDPDPKARAHAGRAFAGIARHQPAATADALPALAAALGDVNSEVVRSAAEALQELALARPESAGTAIGALAGRFDLDVPGDVGGADAAEVLGHLADRYPDLAVPALRRGLESRAPATRVKALQRLLDVPETVPGAVTTAEAMDVLAAELSRPPEPGQRGGPYAGAFTVVGWLEDQRAADGFIARLDPAGRRRLAEALARLIGRIDPNPLRISEDDPATYKELATVSDVLAALGADGEPALPTLDRYVPQPDPRIASRHVLPWEMAAEDIRRAVRAQAASDLVQ